VERSTIANPVNCWDATSEKISQSAAKPLTMRGALSREGSETKGERALSIKPYERRTSQGMMI
jgi:hypothetical protein